MTDAEFLALKQRYYDDRSKLTWDRAARMVETDIAGVSNQEQFALRWAYEKAIDDMKALMLRNLLGPFGK